MLFACSEKSGSKPRRPKILANVLEEISSRVSYHERIKKAASTNVAEAETILAEMVGNNVSPSTLTFNYIIKAYGVSQNSILTTALALQMFGTNAWKFVSSTTWGALCSHRGREGARSHESRECRAQCSHLQHADRRLRQELDDRARIGSFLLSPHMLTGEVKALRQADVRNHVSF